MEEATASSSAALSHDKEDFCCPICQEIFQTPVRIESCQHVFCRKCFMSAVKASGARCPLCRGAICRRERSAPTRASDIEIEMRTHSAGCMYCGKQVKLSCMRLHYKSCKSYQEEYGIAPKEPRGENTDGACATKPMETTYTCPLCPQQDLNRQALLDHCIFMHYFEDGEARSSIRALQVHKLINNEKFLPFRITIQKTEVKTVFPLEQKLVCPICCTLPWGNPGQETANIVAHLNSRHRFSYEEFMNVYLDEDAQYQAAIDKSCFT